MYVIFPPRRLSSSDGRDLGWAAPAGLEGNQILLSPRLPRDDDVGNSDALQSTGAPPDLIN